MAKKASKKDEHGLPSLALVFGYIAVKDLALVPQIRAISALP
jgi:hypothetical protein